MSPQLQQAAGSPLWQLVFVSFAVILVLFEVLRGWRRGVARQIARLGALVAAYFAAYFGGQYLVPVIRPFLKIPDVVMSILAGAILALIIYAVINSLGTILFRRTSQHQSAFVRLLYGFGGAAFGLFFGAFLVWVVVVGIRSLGSVADVQNTNDTNAGPARTLHAVDVRRGVLNETNDDATVMTSLARLKNSIEMGAFGDVVKKADVVPTMAYETLGKLGRVVSNPESAQKFLSFPGARELSEHPKIVALRDDPAIQDLIAQGRFIELLQDQKIIDAANDPALFNQIKNFHLQQALDFSLQPNSTQ